MVAALESRRHVGVGGMGRRRQAGVWGGRRPRLFLAAPQRRRQVSVGEGWQRRLLLPSRRLRLWD